MINYRDEADYDTEDFLKDQDEMDEWKREDDAKRVKDIQAERRSPYYGD